MKEFEEALLKLKPDQVITKDVQQEFTLKGRIILRRGMFLFACNYKDMTVEIVNPQRKVIMNSDGSITKQNKAFYDPNCLYIQAINQKNAERKFIKIIQKYMKKSK